MQLTRRNHIGVLLATAVGAFLCPISARAECRFTPNAAFADAAREQFNCSSTRALKGAPVGETEFQARFTFPASLPARADYPWSRIDFKQYPEAFLRALLAYGIKENSKADIDWRIEKNTSESWCHAPWFQAQRERLHGMTLERGSRARELHDLQLSRSRNWAVGFYNDVGCHGLGKVWADPGSPKTRDFAFDPGTYAIKLLFTDAGPDQVPYLSGSKIWNAAINEDGSVVPMRLLQVDVAVRDSRADEFTGWLFGTFIYDNDQSGASVWEKLVPVGLMWGNDPDLNSANYEELARVPVQGWVNPKVAAKFFHLPRHNLGLHGRLNGPVDNFKSSCLACHGQALDWGRDVRRNTPEATKAANLTPLVPEVYDNDSVAAYFRNITPPNSFVNGTQSLDYSL